MPTSKKSAGAKKSRAAAGAEGLATQKAMNRIPAGTVEPYGVAIREAVARGDQAEMRRVASQARKHLNDVQKALEKLERKLGQSGG